MISRREFIQSIIAGAITTPFLGVSYGSMLSGTASFQTRHIPGWSRQVTSLFTEQAFPFVDFFKNNYLIIHDDDPVDLSFNVVHHNLFAPPLSVKKLNEGVDLFVISAHLEAIDNLERIYLFESFVQNAALSFGCFTLPPGTGGIQSILRNKNIIQILDRLPCSIVLIDTQAIERTVPRLPLANSNDSNRDRILQTAICGMLEPVVTLGIIGIDFADLQAVLKNSKLFGMGIGFINMTDDLEKATEEAFNAICNQITPDAKLNNTIGGGWINVCGNQNMTMEHYESVAKRICNSIHEDANITVSLTVDNGLSDHVMETCFFSLV